MSKVDDVAAYILQMRGQMSTWKLQKLVYYSQAWHLAWEEEALFPDRIEAWANGPVVKALYTQHRGEFTVAAWPSGDPDALPANECETIDVVLDSYGNLSGRQLSHLTHEEAPWCDARGDLSPTASSNAEITQDALLAFYSALDASPDAPSVASIDWDQS